MRLKLALPALLATFAVIPMVQQSQAAPQSEAANLGFALEHAHYGGYREWDRRYYRHGHRYHYRDGGYHHRYYYRDGDYDRRRHRRHHHHWY